MTIVYVCQKCKKESPAWCPCACGGRMSPRCNKLDCHEPGYKGIYAFGYIALVCRKHYDEASQADRDDAIRFRYAEG